MKKVRAAIPWMMIAALLLVSWNSHQQVGAARLQITAARAALLNYHTTAPIDYLFEQLRRAPTKENLAATTYALLERKQKYEALINLHRPQVNRGTWTAFEQRPNEQASLFFLNLSLRADISKEDWEIYDRIVEIWVRQEEHLKIDLGTLVVTNPTSFTYEYVALLKELAAVVPPK